MALAIVALLFSSCEKFEDLQKNPNISSSEQIVPPSRLLNRMLYDIFVGGGYTNSAPGNYYEGPWNAVGRWNQFIVSNDTYYGGNNYYDWSVSATMYDVLTNAQEMEKWANPKMDATLNTNPYVALAKFLKAYSFIWLTQRVGDIPMTEAGKGLLILKPKYDSQETVYIKCLDMLDEANRTIDSVINIVKPAPKIEGDIYLGNDLKKWQKTINSYTLRVLVSLSKRADDTPSLKVKERFAAILGDAVKYPVFTSNSDHVAFKFNSLYNKHPKVGIAGNYNSRHNISKTWIDLAVKYKDPRLFVIATPAPAEIKAGKMGNDHTAYNGSDNNLPIADLSKNSADGKYSFSNYNRYYKQDVVVNTPEPYIIIGYPELCFNIAEGINRGWAAGDASAWYVKGITASNDFYGVKESTILTIADKDGKTITSDTVKFNDFLASAEVTYKGDNTDGLQQILEQKYISFFQNSGWEAYYQWRRTAVPAFLEGGSGVNASKKIPRRFQYPAAEKTENAENYNAAIQIQFGDDDLYKDLWLVK